MIRLTRFATIAAVVSLAGSLSAHAQWWKLNHGNVAVGGTGQFNTVLTSNPNTVPYTSGTTTVNVGAQRQDTTWSAGFISSMQLHPVSWAGIQLNYGYTHYQERYSFNYSNTSVRQYASVPTDWHEATAGYLVHPKHIPFQPYMVIGGGAIDFLPAHGNAYNNLAVSYGHNQWRGAGLLEMGFDMPTHSKHVGFRVSGRSLYYRAPNFGTPQISTRSWRVTTEPAVSVYYKF